MVPPAKSHLRLPLGGKSSVGACCWSFLTFLMCLWAFGGTSTQIYWASQTWRLEKGQPGYACGCSLHHKQRSELQLIYLFIQSQPVWCHFSTLQPTIGPGYLQSKPPIRRKTHSPELHSPSPSLQKLQVSVRLKTPISLTISPWWSTSCQGLSANVGFHVHKKVIFLILPLCIHFS